MSIVPGTPHDLNLYIPTTMITQCLYTRSDFGETVAASSAKHCLKIFNYFFFGGGRGTWTGNDRSGSSADKDIVSPAKDSPSSSVVVMWGR